MNLDIKYIIILFVVLFIFLSQRKEKYANFCQNCEDMSLDECKNCPDCGICVNDFGAKCVKGDENGPYFYDTCNKWIYMGDEQKHECWLYDEKYSQHNCGNYVDYPTRSKMHKMFARTYGDYIL
jgi:hypothetical protein